MALLAAPDSTLQAIQNKVRRLTRSPSTAQISDATLQEYINTFVVYDFPEHLRTFNLRKTFTFYTNPYQDEYPTDRISFGTNVLAQNNPLYNFQNNYITVHPPFYVAGYQSTYTQSQEQFFGYWPKVNSIAFTGFNGDGIQTSFSGVVNSQNAIIPPNFNQHIALLQRNVLFSSIDTALNRKDGLVMVDIPLIDPATGNTTVTGRLYDPYSAAYQAALITPPTNPADFDATNFIDYSTGLYTVTFPSPPGPNQPVNVDYVAQTIALPRAILYYGNKFTIRPVPDQVYSINFEVYQRPVSLLATSQSPELEEYWQYISYGAAKKIFEDRMDLDSVQMIMPEFKKQENMMQRRTIVQYTNERTATIYTEQTSGPTTGGFGWGGGSNV